MSLRERERERERETERDRGGGEREREKEKTRNGDLADDVSATKTAKSASKLEQSKPRVMP